MANDSLFLKTFRRFRAATMEIEASLYHAPDNISSIMSVNSGASASKAGLVGASASNVGARRRKVNRTLNFTYRAAFFCALPLPLYRRRCLPFAASSPALLFARANSAEKWD